MTTLVEVEGWAGALEKLVGGLASRFFREAGVRRALSYLRGLLAPLERKNGWQLAEAAGDVSPAAMQDFLTRTRWDASSKRGPIRSGSSGSTPAPPAGSRTVRSPSSSATPARVAGR